MGQCLSAGDGLRWLPCHACGKVGKVPDCTVSHVCLPRCTGEGWAVATFAAMLDQLEALGMLGADASYEDLEALMGASSDELTALESAEVAS